MTGRWRSMGLSDQEYSRILELMGREPNETELGMFAVMWSEHCGYKNSRPLLKLFPTQGPRVLQGPGENAGVIDIGDGQAVVFKMESHNHPSAIEPYQGAATGVGGIVRDIFAMGARPIACLDSLRFGDLKDRRTAYLFSGVVAGIAGYGNAIGVPTVGGEAFFSPSYQGNPLVNAMCVGLLEGAPAKGIAAGVGNPVLLVGAKTGRDGIHGATFASEELGEGSEERRPAVQVGDPFREKLLIEACLEILKTDYVVGIQDLGAAGITSSAVEMAGRAGTGMRLDISRVPRREPGMTPYEVMLSESQERMLLVIKKGYEDAARRVFSRWGLDATVIGHVTDDGVMRVWDGETPAAEIPVRYLTDEVPTYVRTGRVPAYLKEAQAFDWHVLPEPADYNAALLKLIASPNIASHEWIWRQYDHMVQANTVVLPGSDAAVLRVKSTPKGLALTTDGNGRYTYLDPYTGGMIAVAEAARNLAACGAEPLGITDCLNFGNPEKPEVYWQLQQAVEGMADACRALGIPVVSGNVSLYNETEGRPIFPTPVVGMVGLLPDIAKRAVQGFRGPGDVIVLLGSTEDELGGSEYLYALHGVEQGRPPRLHLEREARVQEACRTAVRRALLASAHDLSEGGLVVALAECCLAGRQGPVGARVTVPRGELSRTSAYFSETQSRILVSLPEENLPQLAEIVQRLGVPYQVLGRTGGERLEVDDAISLPLAALQEAWREGLACHL
ncbi:phosphoribosylformylglycinamidine synthase subunit PurL [Gelria sp. Kuro-4]|nr:phosphoribosylformylglycinamidine synthase subunit PurL [Gelria sp. Kuro-4]BCV24466.1 phosphoribosylformylglycinamidine synthase subunit PurL [Gelria sp. Kuro-4]